jgi:iron(III) transport system substrate-binding protein
MSAGGGTRSLPPTVKEPEGRVPLKDIKLLRGDPEAQEKAIEEIKRKYAEYFGT